MVTDVPPDVVPEFGESDVIAGGTASVMLADTGVDHMPALLR